MQEFFHQNHIVYVVFARVLRQRDFRKNRLGVEKIGFPVLDFDRIVQVLDQSSSHAVQHELVEQFEYVGVLGPYVFVASELGVSVGVRTASGSSCEAREQRRELRYTFIDGRHGRHFDDDRPYRLLSVYDYGSNGVDAPDTPCLCRTALPQFDASYHTAEPFEVLPRRTAPVEQKHSGSGHAFVVALGRDGRAVRARVEGQPRERGFLGTAQKRFAQLGGLERTGRGIAAVGQVKDQIGTHIPRALLPQDDEAVRDAQSEFAPEAVAPHRQTVETVAPDGNVHRFEIQTLGREGGIPQRLERAERERPGGRFSRAGADRTGGFVKFAGRGRGEARPVPDGRLRGCGVDRTGRRQPPRGST